MALPRTLSTALGPQAAGTGTGASRALYQCQLNLCIPSNGWGKGPWGVHPLMPHPHFQLPRGQQAALSPKPVPFPRVFAASCWNLAFPIQTPFLLSSTKTEGCCQARRGCCLLLPAPATCRAGEVLLYVWPISQARPRDSRQGRKRRPPSPCLRRLYPGIWPRVP